MLGVPWHTKQLLDRKHVTLPWFSPQVGVNIKKIFETTTEKRHLSQMSMMGFSSMPSGGVNGKIDFPQPCRGNLVSGWFTNPIEKYAPQIGSLIPNFRGKNKTCLKPPPRNACRVEPWPSPIFHTIFPGLHSLIKTNNSHLPFRAGPQAQESKDCLPSINFSSAALASKISGAKNLSVNIPQHTSAFFVIP